jgi:hypothetical protein
MTIITTTSKASATTRDKIQLDASIPFNEEMQMQQSNV